MGEFIFPFTTCEKPHNSIIMQPASAVVNFVTCIILMYFAIATKTFPVKLMILAYLSFELWHTASHIQHISGYLQTNIIHILAYLLAFTTLYSIMYLSKKGLSTVYIIILLILVIIDTYVWLYVGGIRMVIGGLLILFVIIIGSYNNLPKFFKKVIPWLIAGLVLLLLIIYNETVNCEKMLEFADFPYHIIIELLGLVLFSTLAYNFYKWEKSIV